MLKESNNNSIDHEKNEVAIKLLSSNDKSLIEAVKFLLDDFSVNQPAKKITKAQYNKELAAAEKRIKSGKFVTNGAAVKAIKSW